MQSSDYDVETLNDLIATTIDSADGCRAAAEDVADRDLQTGYFARAKARDGIAERLQDYVRELGGAPVDGSTAAGAAHRLFAGIREGAGGDDESVAAEIERGEDHLRAKYERALSDADLAPRTRELITDLFRSAGDPEGGTGQLKLAA